MANLSTIEALRIKLNKLIKTNYQQLITGMVLNGFLHDVQDTVKGWFDAHEESKLDKTAIGYDPVSGINLPAGAQYKLNGVNILSLVINGGGSVPGGHDASTGLLPTTGTGQNGAILNNNFWRVVAPGTIVGLQPISILEVGDVIFSTTDNATDIADFLGFKGNQDVEALDSRVLAAETKLIGIDEYATNDQTADEIKALVESLTGNSKIDATLALKNVLNVLYSNQSFPDLDTLKKAIDQALTSSMSQAERQKLNALPTNADLLTALANKVSAEVGKGLSQVNFTTEKDNKLAGLSEHYRGTHTSLANLRAAIPTGNTGDEALVDAGAGTNAIKYIWDAQEGWISGGGSGASSFSELSGNPGDNSALASAFAAKVSTNGTDRLLTAAEATKLANQSGTNTGDQDLSGLMAKPSSRDFNKATGVITLTEYLKKFRPFIVDEDITISVDEVTAEDGCLAQLIAIGDGSHSISFLDVENQDTSKTFNNALNMGNRILLGRVAGVNMYRILKQEEFVADIIAPTLQQAVINQSAKNQIVLSYSESLDPDSEVTYTISGGKTITNVQITGATVTITVNSNFAFGDSVTLSSSGALKDMSENEATDLLNQQVTNYIINPNLSAPSVSITSVSQTELDVNLSNIANNNGYEVQVGTQSNLSDGVTHTLAQNVTLYQILGLTAGNTRYARARTIGDGINTFTSGWSSIYSGTTSENQVPVASNVSIQNASANHKPGDTLTGQYTYSDAENDTQGTSLYRWLSSDTSNGTYTAITGATASTYQLQVGDVGKYLRFEVTPVASTGSLQGIAVQSVSSSQILANEAPVASALTITGTIQVGQVVTGSYTYSDPESNSQDTTSGGSEYQLKTYADAAAANADTTNASGTSVANGYTGGSAIPQLSYSIVVGDVGKVFKLWIRPKATAGTLLGNWAGSAASITVPPAGFVAANTEYQAVYNAYVNKPDNTRAGLEDQFVTRLKAIGWSKFKVIGFFVRPTNAGDEIKIDWANTAHSFIYAGAYNGGTGGVGFTADRGVWNTFTTPTKKFMGVNLNMTTVLSASDCGRTFVVMTDKPATDNIELNGNYSPFSTTYIKHANGSCAFYLAGASYSMGAGSNNDSRGIYTIRYSALLPTAVFKNAVKLGTNANVTTGFNTTNGMGINACNLAGGGLNETASGLFTANETNQYSTIGMDLWHLALTDSEAIALHTAIEEYLDAIGAGLIN